MTSTYSPKLTTYFVIVSEDIDPSGVIFVDCESIEAHDILEAIASQYTRERVITIGAGLWFAYGPAKYLNKIGRNHCQIQMRSDFRCESVIFDTPPAGSCNWIKDSQ